MELRLSLILSVLLHLSLMRWAGRSIPRESRFLLGSQGQSRDFELVVSLPPSGAERVPRPSMRRRQPPARELSEAPVAMTMPGGTTLSPEPEQSISLARVVAEGNSPPEYPEEAERRGWEGQVRLRVLLDGSGAVEHVEVVTPSGYQVLDQAAVQAAITWKFSFRPSPRVALLVPVKFQLD